MRLRTKCFVYDTYLLLHVPSARGMLAACAELIKPTVQVRGRTVEQSGVKSNFVRLYAQATNH